MDPKDFIPVTTFKKSSDPKCRKRPCISTTTCTFPDCGKQSDTYRDILKHVRDTHECLHCGLGYPTKLEKIKHEDSCTPQVGGGSDEQDEYSGKFSLVKEAHGRANTEYLFEYDSTPEVSSFETAFEIVESELVKLLEFYFKKFNGVSASITLNTTMEKVKDQETFARSFFSNFTEYQHLAFFKSKLKWALDRLNSRLSLYKDTESGCRLKSVNSMLVKIQPGFSHGVGGTYIEVPHELTHKGIISIKSHQNCFQLCTLLGIYKAEIKLPEIEAPMPWGSYSFNERKRLVRVYENPKTYNDFISRKELNWENFDSEMSVADIPKFEEANPLISITAFEYKPPNVFPIYVTPIPRKHHINLLLLSKNTTNGKIFHWTFVPQPGKLFSRDKNHAAELCEFCLKRLVPGTTRHRELCQKGNPCRMKFPPEEFYTFKQYRAYLPPMYRIFIRLSKQDNIDLPNDAVIDDCMDNYTNGARSSVKNWSLLVMNFDNEISEYIQGYGMNSFFRTLDLHLKTYKKRVKSCFVPVEFTPELKQRVKNASSCEICKREFTLNETISQRVVVHHHHLSTNKDLHPLSLTCSSCNIKIVKTAIVVLDHDLASQNGMLMLSELNAETLKRFEIVGRDATNIISMKIDNSMMIDTTKFLNMPIHELGRWLTGNKNCYHACPTFYEGIGYLRENESLIPHYGMFADMVTVGLLPISEFKEFPPLEVLIKQDSYANMPLREFHEMYQFTIDVFEKLCSQEMHRYHRLYNTYHVCILADAIWALERFCLTHFKVTCLYSPTINSFAWMATMAYTKATYQYLKDHEMIDFVQRSIIGPIEVSSHKLSKANSERFYRFMDPLDNELRTENVGIDSNMIYLGGCIGPMPVSDYVWVQDPVIEPLPTGVGRLYEVTLEYDKSLHIRDNELPLCPYKRKIEASDLGETQQSLLEAWKGSMGNPLLRERTVLDFKTREKLVIHHEALNYYIQRGLVATKVHRALQFTEEPVLEPIVNLIVELRRRAIKENDKVTAHLCKIIAVSIYGQTLKHKDGYLTTQLAATRERSLELASRHNMVDSQIISKNLVMYKMAPCSYIFDNALLWATTMLARSKVVLFKGKEEFEQEFKNAKLVLSQTDSLWFSVPLPENNLNEKLARLENMFDFSNLPPDHEIRKLVKDPDANCMVPNKWKLESEKGCCLVEEIISIRPKLFSFLLNCPRDCEKSRDVIKGVSRKANNALSHNDMRRMLDLNAMEWTEFVKSGFTYHRWNALDVSRYLCEDKVSTLAFGHFELEQDDQLSPS